MAEASSLLRYHDMEQYIVSARKYRPTTFGSVVGQQALATTLKNAIVGNRLAHAYLFCGSRGVGKTSCARIFAKTINCTNRTPQGEACNECDSCRQFNEGRSLNIIELDAASHNGIDDIKGLIDQVMVPPTTGRYRVFIIDEVHMLTSQAFNAFLKTLEEPPSYVIFILATTEKHKIIPTILSRCQIYDFNRISAGDMVAHMQHVAKEEGIEADPAALSIIAGKADGAMRDALSIFDQVAASGGGKITYEATVENLNVLDSSYYSRLVDAFVAKDVPSALLIYKEVRSRGFDSQFFINGLGMYMRDLMVASDPSTISLLEAPEDVKERMAAQASKLHPTFFYRAMELCNEADFNFRQASNKQFLIELTLIRLCQRLSPSSDESGSDGGQLKPLEAAAPAATHTVQEPSSTYSSAVTAPESKARAEEPVTAAPPKISRPEYVPGGFSLRNKNLTVRDTVPDTQVTSRKESRHDAFTDADMKAAWDKTVKKYVKEPVIYTTLLLVKPELREGSTYALAIGSTVQIEILEKELAALTRSLRDDLSNDDIVLTVEKIEGDLAPAFWTEDKVLQDMLARHPHLGEIMNKYKMRLI